MEERQKVRVIISFWNIDLDNFICFVAVDSCVVLAGVERSERSFDSVNSADFGCFIDKHWPTLWERPI